MARSRLTIATTSLRTWHRQHAGGIVTEVVPVLGIGTWKVCAKTTTVPERVESVDHSFTLLVDAHAAADALARDVFEHVCDSRCGHWCQEERRTGTN